MDIVYLCADDGRKLYAVREYSSDLFVGTRAECGRFLILHNRKVLAEREDAMRTARHPQMVVKTYRAASRVGA